VAEWFVKARVTLWQPLVAVQVSGRHHQCVERESHEGTCERVPAAGHKWALGRVGSLKDGRTTRGRIRMQSMKGKPSPCTMGD